VEPRFLLNTFSLHSIRKQIEQKAKSTSGVNNINTGEIQSLVVAVCGIEEQKQIQMEIETRLSSVYQLDQTIAASLQQAEGLRQSILKKAFSGQLVPQDPHDEPASALLARIKADKVQQTKESKKPISRSQQNE
jgi:type I restriction enzyme S subunit